MSSSSSSSDPAATPAVPLFDNQRQYHELAAEVEQAVLDVCRSGRYVLGPPCLEFEQRVAPVCGARHAIACASGSDALLLALMALEIGPGDEVLVPSYSFFATASAVARLGARPVFVDIEPSSFNLDPARLAEACTARTRAIIPVHLYGQAAEMNAIRDFAAQRNVSVIEDAAQAIGAEYRGRRVGSLGQMACFSFYPTKNLGCFGDGGLLTTDDDTLADRLRLLRGHGMQPRYYHQLLGINSRLDSIQAAVLNVKLGHLDRWTEARQGIAERYQVMFAAAGLDGVLGLPRVLADRRHVWNQYVVRVPGGQRDALRAFLTESRIGTEIYYPVAIHEQACFATLAVPAGSLPVTEQATRESLALPIFPELTPNEQERVVAGIAKFFATRPRGSSIPAPKFLAERGATRRSS